MCYSEKVSLYTFITGIIGSALCFSVGTVEYKIVGMFFAFVILMQLIEYLLWKHQICDSYNTNLSRTAMILNHLQPIILFLAILLFNKVDKKMISLLIIYTISISIYSFGFLKKGKCTVKNDNSSHLKWEWNNLKYNKLIYCLFLICFVLFGLWGFPTKKSALLFSSLCFFSFVLSKLIYGNQEAVGAMWCFFAAFTPILYLILYVLK